MTKQEKAQSLRERKDIHFNCAQSVLVTFAQEAGLTEEEAMRRLKTLAATTDGFQIAQADLEQRGPGDFFGSRQHGLPTLKTADLSCDMRLLDEAQSAAKALLAADPALSAVEHRSLRQRIGELFELNAEALN